MIKNFIPQQEIKRHHPKGMASHTDCEYTQLAMHMPAPLLKYAMDHDMLPDASVMSIRGEEHGRKIFQENYDFLVRAIMRDQYVEG